MNVTIYHNPACSTSQRALALLRQHGVEPEIIEYLTSPPTREELMAIVEKTGRPARDLMRRRGTPYDELGLDDPKWTEEQLMEFVAKHPVLLNRPVVVSDKGAKLCRPPESVLELLEK